jgi:hypothetical protein
MDFYRNVIFIYSPFNLIDAIPYFNLMGFAVKEILFGQNQWIPSILDFFGFH